MKHQHISKSRARKRIRLCGTSSTGYLVLSGGFDGLLPIAAPTQRTARAIAAALRELAVKGGNNGH